MEFPKGNNRVTYLYLAGDKRSGYCAPLKTYFAPFNWAKTALVVSRRNLLPSLCLGVAALLVLSSENAAAQARSRFFPIRQGSQPFDITMGADGNFWFTLSNSNEVARITPHARIDYFVTPSLSNPAFITPGPDGNIWFGEGSTGKIAFVTPAGDITELQFSFFGVSVGITTGPDDNIWFTDQTDHAVWRYDLSSGVFKRFKTPTANSYPGDITTGPDGNMWFTEQAVDKFARITPAGVITEFTGVSSPTSISRRTGRQYLGSKCLRGPSGARYSCRRHHPLPDRPVCPASFARGIKTTFCSPNSALTNSGRSRRAGL